MAAKGGRSLLPQSAGPPLGFPNRRRQFEAMLRVGASGGLSLSESPVVLSGLSATHGRGKAGDRLRPIAVPQGGLEPLRDI